MPHEVRKARKLEEITLVIGLRYDPKRMPPLSRDEISDAIMGQLKNHAYVTDFRVVLGGISSVFGPSSRSR